MKPRHADRFQPLPPAKAEPWMKYAQWDTPYFAKYIGVVVEEVRDGYARMRLPIRTELMQPQGVMHGGAIATLIDTAVVPAIAAPSPERLAMVTVSMNIEYLGAATTDVVAEAWVTKRTRALVFCQIEVAAEAGLVATGSLVYKVRPL